MIVAPELQKELVAGIWPGMSEEEYNAIPALRSTRLKQFYDCPSDFPWYAEHPGGDKDVYRVGRGIHCKVLQPELYPQLYINDLVDISKTMKRGSDTWKARLAEGKITAKTKDRGEWLAWCALQTSKGLTILPEKERDQIEFVSRHILEHKQAKKLVTPNPEFNTQVEVCAVAQDPATGVWMKARADHRYWMADDGYTGWTIIDLKTTRDARKAAASYDITGRYAYFLSAEHHRHVFKLATGKKHAFSFVFFQKTEPYRCCTATIRDDIETVGRRIFCGVMREFKHCQDTAEWSDHSEKPFVPQASKAMKDQADAYELAAAEAGDHPF